MPDLTFINHANKIVPLQEAAVPVLSPGSLFADPMYESISVSHHNPFYLCHPLQCLEQKIPPIRMNLPTPTMSKIPKIVKQLIRRSSSSDAQFYI